MSFRIHFFQHVPYEDPGYILTWCSQKNIKVSFTRFYERGVIPDPASYDCLVVMGGPMGVYDEKDYPWLALEKEAIASTIKAQIPVLGICLGAQLVASSLGAAVYKNKEKEIGWFDIRFTPAGNAAPFFKKNLNPTMTVFHWHGDTFDLPENAELLASSDACKNQAYLYGSRVIGLQFHFEVTEAGLTLMLENGKSELVSGKYIQNSQEILRYSTYITENNALMAKIMDWITSD
jgi:GMP synthase-like glutamine amidotransferase